MRGWELGIGALEPILDSLLFLLPIALFLWVFGWGIYFVYCLRRKKNTEMDSVSKIFGATKVLGLSERLHLLIVIVGWFTIISAHFLFDGVVVPNSWFAIVFTIFSVLVLVSTVIVYLNLIFYFSFEKSVKKLEQEENQSDFDKLMGCLKYRAGAHKCDVEREEQTARLAALLFHHYGRGMADAAAITLGEERAAKISMFVEESVAQIDPLSGEHMQERWLYKFADVVHGDSLKLVPRSK